MTDVPRPAERLTIYLSRTDRQGRVPDYVEIVERAREARLAGATVVQGFVGFGTSARVHRRHALSVTEHVPVAITIIDTPARITAFLASIESLLRHGRAVRRPVRVVIDRNGTSRRGSRP